MISCSSLATATVGLTTYLFVFENFQIEFCLLVCDCLLIVGVIDMALVTYFVGLVKGMKSTPGAFVIAFRVTGMHAGFLATSLSAGRGGGSYTTLLHGSHFTKYPSDVLFP